MPDFSQSAPGIDPPTVVDHVLLPVPDLDAGAIPFVIEWHVPDGLHPGEATASDISLRRVVIAARQPDAIQRKLELLLGRSPMVEVREADVDGVRQIVLQDGDRELTIG